MSEYTIVTGDCVEAMRAMQPGSVDAIITDIPYNEVNRASNGLRSFDKGTADSAPINVRRFVDECVRISAGWIYIWCGAGQLAVIRRRLNRHGLTARSGVWWKSDPSPANGEHLWLSAIEWCVIAKKPGAYFDRHCKPPVWRGPIERNIDWHPTPKPVWLMRELVTASVPPGGTVLDPYMGSGAVGVAALAEGRRFIGCEINPDWSARASRRLLDVNLDMFHGAA